MNIKKICIAAVAAFYATACIENENSKHTNMNNNTTAEWIQPSATSSATDFDFLVGKWSVKNRRFSNNQWIEFDAELHMRKTINGLGNVENYYSTFNGKPFEGQAVRLFNPQTKLWTVYWMDSNNPVMDAHPVTGSFENKLGKLYANDSLNGKPIIVLYQWDAADDKHPKWGQATSADNGKTWDWNWEMILTRIQ
jgi:hypothetical protein